MLGARILVGILCFPGSFGGAASGHTFVMFALQNFIWKMSSLHICCRGWPKMEKKGRIGNIAFGQPFTAWVRGREACAGAWSPETFMQNFKKAYLLQAASYHKASKLALTDLRELYTRHSSVNRASLESTMAVKLQALKEVPQNVAELFLSHLTLFKYDSWDKTKRLKELAAVRKRHLITFFENLWEKVCSG